MKAVRKIMTALLLAAVLIQFTALPAFASSMEHEGLEVTVQMDKEVYEEGEPITATITVKNTNAEAVTITNLEQLIPEGYKLAEDSIANTTDVVLGPGETVTLNVTYGEPLESSAEETVESFFDTLIFGESFGIPNILIALIVIIAIFVFFKLT
ncbi:MAG: hypothetical protein IJ306_10765 [Oscillospiraceae bacterium]|nr:hypothetical protein [Oscillospiraceae bacterium]